VEILAVNGEDHYAASGEVDYLTSNDLTEVRPAVKVDGVGYRGAPTAYSPYGVSEEASLGALAELVAGPPWPQSDHMVSARAGTPAIAVTSAAFTEVMLDVAHSPHDTPDLVDVALLDQAARAIARLVETWP
jgi:aminopeptidase YwaD